MTLIAGWTRRVAPHVEELVIAADSRLTGGQRWDACPKVFMLPRTDAALAFCGDTYYAYPIVEQIRSAIAIYHRSASRALDIVYLLQHLVAFLNGMLDAIHSLPSNDKLSGKPNDTRFLLGGYSWEYKSFFLWRIVFDESTKRFTHWSVGKNKESERLLAFDGDHEKTEDPLPHVLPYARELNGRLMAAHGLQANNFCNYEPLEVIREMSRDARFDTIGGAPQVLKVYQHLNVMPYAVFWPDRKSGTISYLGRPLLDYEKSSYLVMDPDTVQTVKFDDARQQFMEEEQLSLPSSAPTALEQETAPAE